MDMGTAARAFKETRNEDIVFFKNYAADRAYPVPVSVKAVHAAPDVHEPVFAAVEGWEGEGTDELSVLQFGGTYRTGLGIAGCAFSPGLKAAAPAGAAAPQVGCSSQDGDAYAKKKRIAEPEQDNPYNYKNQNFKDILHSFVCSGNYLGGLPFKYYTKYSGDFIYYRYSYREFGRFKLQGGGNFQNRRYCGL